MSLIIKKRALSGHLHETDTAYLHSSKQPRPVSLTWQHSNVTPAYTFEINCILGSSWAARQISMVPFNVKVGRVPQMFAAYTALVMADGDKWAGWHI